ncbi:hypothetical protein EW145_g4960 [Phellinidium pouzarii]|uniref:Protein kinase domain-containing protein n=1 Tax=Phellinidium pouzarii TaxID=167371 RepID=A0A4S4L1M7_9AGAM|nr:hypothetical protein EW145_g4960 [Phellinidium pouzarii]
MEWAPLQKAMDVNNKLPRHIDRIVRMTSTKDLEGEHDILTFTQAVSESRAHHNLVCAAEDSDEDVQSNQNSLIPSYLKCEKPGEEEKAFFLFGGDPTKYDSSHQITVVYTRNYKYRDCLENMLLSSSMPKLKKYDRIAAAIAPFLGNLEAFYMPATGIYLVTGEDRKLTFETFQDTEVVNLMQDLSEVPSSLSTLPVALINDLTKVDKLGIGVDLVTWYDEQYAFKKTVFAASILKEVEALYRLRGCSAINPPIALVIKDSPEREDTTGQIRGFLSPYMPGRDLTVLFESRKKTLGLIWPATEISWATKTGWVFELALALLAMEKEGISNGDIKPENVLFDGRAGVRLTDFAPVGPTYGWCAPEYAASWEAFHAHSPETDSSGSGVGSFESEGGQRDCDDSLSSDSYAKFDFEGTLTPAMDMYGLGAIMWVIGEEKTHGLERRTWELSPAWYRDLAESCLVEDPARRPSPTAMLFKLFARRMLLMLQL